MKTVKSILLMPASILLFRTGLCRHQHKRSEWKWSSRSDRAGAARRDTVYLAETKIHHHAAYNAQTCEQFLLSCVARVSLSFSSSFSSVLFCVLLLLLLLHVFALLFPSFLTPAVAPLPSVPHRALALLHSLRASTSSY